jgi:Ig-like domain from next to BRCA1 gene
MMQMKKCHMVVGLLFTLLAVPTLMAAENDAKVIMQMVPDQVPAGKEFTAIIQIKNTGNSTWSADRGYNLATLTSQPWDSYRVELGSTVAPDQTITLKPQLIAPMIPGEYPLQWQMRQGESLFGDKTASVKVHITGSFIPLNLSEFVYQNVPLTMVAGQTYNVILQFKNTGETVWTPGQYQLVSIGDAGLTWIVDAVDIKRNIATPPDGFQTFNFDIQAPNEPGVYPFQWRMQQKQTGLFGAASPLLKIEVKRGGK